MIQQAKTKTLFKAIPKLKLIKYLVGRAARAARLLVNPQLAPENGVADRHLGHVEPEPARDLKVLLVAVVDEAHDDVALVDSLWAQESYIIFSNNTK